MTNCGGLQHKVEVPAHFCHTFCNHRIFFPKSCNQYYHWNARASYSRYFPGILFPAGNSLGLAESKLCNCVVYINCVSAKCPQTGQNHKKLRGYRQRDYENGERRRGSFNQKEQWSASMIALACPFPFKVTHAVSHRFHQVFINSYSLLFLEYS